MIDLGRELFAALASPEGRALLDEVVSAAVRREVRAALAEREADRLLDAPALAAFLGCSAGALRQRLRRGSPLAGLAVELDGRRVWRRGEVAALLQRSRGAEVVAIDAARRGAGR